MICYKVFAGIVSPLCATVAACLGVVSFMERSGTGFQTMVDSYTDADADKQPVAMAYPSFLDLRLFDLLYEDETPRIEMTERDLVVGILRAGPKSVRVPRRYRRSRMRAGAAS